MWHECNNHHIPLVSDWVNLSEKHKQGKYRPIKIMMHNTEDRDSVTCNVFKLSDADEESVKGIHLGFEMTLGERKAVDEKIAETNETKNANITLLVEDPRVPMGITPEEGEEKESTRRTSPNIAKTLHKNTHINNIFFDNLKIWYTHTDTLTSSKRNELAARVKLDNLYIIIIEIYPTNSINDITEDLKIDGYEIVRSNGSRGVAIYTATTLWPPSLRLIQIFKNPCGIKSK